MKYGTPSISFKEQYITPQVTRNIDYAMYKLRAQGKRLLLHLIVTQRMKQLLLNWPVFLAGTLEHTP